jgi:glycosyltransferase involved in cell wall biosynthesis
MKTVKKLTYIANIRLPSEKAHPVQVMKMCEAFTDNGCTVRLLVPRRVQTAPALKKVKDVWAYYGIRDRFRITKLPCLDLIWMDTFTQFLRSFRFVIEAASFAFIAFIYGLCTAADCYYTREYPFAVWFGAWRFLHRKKVFYEVHRFEPFICKYVRWGWIAGLVVITGSARDKYLAAGIPEGKVLLVPDGVDVKMFACGRPRDEARRELGIPVDRKVVCYTGHLYDWKGADVLALSMKQLNDDFLACFVGGTEEDIDAFRKFIRQNEIPNVTMAGHVAPVTVPLYLAAADVLVLPNVDKGLTEYTSPLKLFEYLASGRPVVASDLPSLREVLNDDNAALVEAGNPEALAAGVRRLLEDPGLAARLIKQGLIDVQRYSWTNRAERILGFIGM